MAAKTRMHTRCTGIGRVAQRGSGGMKGAPHPTSPSVLLLPWSVVRAYNKQHGHS